MPPRQTSSTDRRAARTQIRTADQEARMPKETRARDNKTTEGGELTVPLLGKDFRLSTEAGIMPLMEWAASADVDVNNADGLRAVYYVLKDAVHEDEWAEFRKHARESKAQSEDLLDFANAALEAMAGRPTEEPTGS